MKTQVDKRRLMRGKTNSSQPKSDRPFLKVISRGEEEDDDDDDDLL